jgi:hypothetical protein
MTGDRDSESSLFSVLPNGEQPCPCEVADQDLSLGGGKKSIEK